MTLATKWHSAYVLTKGWQSAGWAGDWTSLHVSYACMCCSNLNYLMDSDQIYTKSLFQEYFSKMSNIWIPFWGKKKCLMKNCEFWELFLLMYSSKFNLSWILPKFYTIYISRFLSILISTLVNIMEDSQTYYFQISFY